MNQAKEKKWLGMVTEYGCVVTGRSDLQRHHVVGRSYKHNKVHIGRVFVLPLCVDLHDVHSNNPLNVTHFRHRFTDEYGMQRDLFKKMTDQMIEDGYILPFDLSLIDVIMDTKY